LLSLHIFAGPIFITTVGGGIDLFIYVFILQLASLTAISLQVLT
jgi:hypothetical protein